MRALSRKQVGFTLVELMIGVAVIAILAAVALPSYSDMLERKRLMQVIQSLKSDLQYARTEAIKRNQPVRFSLRVGNAGAWCYGLTTGTSCACQTPAACDIKQIQGADFGPTDMLGSDIDKTFNNRRGTAEASGVTFKTDKYTARIVVSDVGRVRVCTPTGADRPSGTTGLSSIPNC